MKVLLDSHTLIWAVDNPVKLTANAAAILQDPTNDTVGQRRDDLGDRDQSCTQETDPVSSVQDWMTKAIGDLGATILPITIAHADAQINLPQHHRDPFDRLLVRKCWSRAYRCLVRIRSSINTRSVACGRGRTG